VVRDEGPEGPSEDPNEGGPEQPGRPRDPNDPPPGSIRELIMKSSHAPAPRREEPKDEGPSFARRALTIGIIAAVVAAVWLALTAGEPYKLTASFSNASQVVSGNEVVIGGSVVGSVEKVELGPDGEALVTFSVDDENAPLERGTVATIRNPSLSSIAGRQIQLTVPPATADTESIPDGATLSQDQTVSAVDLDELFNTLDPQTIRDFKHVIQGFELSYEGVGAQANRGLKYLNPFLSTSRRVFGELASDQRAFENLIVDTSRLSGALASRSPELSALIANLNSMMNAIGDRKEALAASISLLPDFMRDANTTFVNLRAALDDLDPLVSASKPAAEELGPFLTQLRAAAADAVPTVRDLDRIVAQKGSANDLVELTALQPALAKSAVGSGSPECGPGAENPEDLLVAADDDYKQGAFGESVCALENSLGNLSFFRAYTPELLGWFNTFSHVGNYAAEGDPAVIALTANVFSPSIPFLPSPATLIDATEAAGLLNLAPARCPGALERPFDAADSIPFTDGGALTDGSQANGECDPEDVATGP
jgi:phospholipid/cholesterol/gamma-HCH transport system substrate-binding protein